MIGHDCLAGGLKDEVPYFEGPLGDWSVPLAAANASNISNHQKEPTMSHSRFVASGLIGSVPSDCGRVDSAD